jgi:hypothetical protein
MTAQYTCSKCGRSSRLPEGFHGDQIRCLSCGTRNAIASSVRESSLAAEAESRTTTPVATRAAESLGPQAIEFQEPSSGKWKGLLIAGVLSLVALVAAIVLMSGRHDRLVNLPDPAKTSPVSTSPLAPQSRQANPILSNHESTPPKANPVVAGIQPRAGAGDPSAHATESLSKHGKNLGAALPTRSGSSRSSPTRQRTSRSVVGKARGLDRGSSSRSLAIRSSSRRMSTLSARAVAADRWHAILRLVAIRLRSG